MIADGERASDEDVWFRILTSEKQINRGVLHHGAFVTHIRKTDPDRKRPWDSEMSGRLRSIAGTADQIIDHGTQYCLRFNTKFVGLAFARCGDLCITFEPEGIVSAVHFTPIKGGKYLDPAHADLTFSGKVVEPRSPDEEILLLKLHKHFGALYPGQIERFLPQVAVE